MADDKVRMPSSTAGITRYFDEYRSKLRFKPGHVLIIGIIVMILIILLHRYGTSFLSTAG
jgi:preprotein translocase subunit Sec61beta